jgi:hypothetical protein
MVSSTLPSPWLNADVGSPGATGSSAYSSGTFTLNGAGGGAYYVPDAGIAASSPGSQLKLIRVHTLTLA